MLSLSFGTHFERIAEEGHTPLANRINVRGIKELWLWAVWMHHTSGDPGLGGVLLQNFLLALNRRSNTLLLLRKPWQGSYKCSNPVGVLAMWIKTMIHRKYFFLVCLCLHVEECLRIEGRYLRLRLLLHHSDMTHHRLGPYTSLSSTRQVVNYIIFYRAIKVCTKTLGIKSENYTARALQMANLRMFFLSAFCFVEPIVMCSLWLFI